MGFRLGPALQAACTTTMRLSRFFLLALTVGLAVGAIRSDRVLDQAGRNGQAPPAHPRAKHVLYVVDVSCLLHRAAAVLGEGGEPELDSGDVSSQLWIANLVQEDIRALADEVLECADHVTVVIVFDGEPPDEKKNKTRKRTSPEWYGGPGHARRTVHGCCCHSMYAVCVGVCLCIQTNQTVLLVCFYYCVLTGRGCLCHDGTCNWVHALHHCVGSEILLSPFN